MMDLIEEVRGDLYAINREIKQTEKAMANLLVRDIHTRASMQRLLVHLRQNKDLMIRRLTTLEREEKFGIREKELRIEKLEAEIDILLGLGSDVEDLSDIYKDIYEIDEDVDDNEE